MRYLSILLLLTCLVLAGCADGTKSANDGNRFGGFYGGVGAGAAP